MIRERSFYQHFIKLALPLVASQLINFMVQMLDSLMVGPLGDDALAAVTLANQPYFIFNSMIFGLASGGAVMVSQYWGKKDMERIRRTMSILFHALALIALIYMALCFFFPASIMGIYSSDPVLIAEGIKYLRVVLFSYILSALAQGYYTSLNAKESTKISLIAYSLSFLINLFANYCFIYGHFGLPAMGVAGAAMGTVIARAWELLFGLLCSRKEKDIQFGWKDMKKIDRSMLPIFIKISMSVAADDLVWSLNTSAQVAVIGHMSSAFVSAASIANVAQNFALVLVYGCSRAASIAMGKYIGEGRHEYALKAGRTFMVMGLVIGVLAAGIILGIRGPMLNLYPGITVETKNLAYEIMGVIALIMLWSGLENMEIAGILRGSGDNGFALLADTVCMWGIGFPVGCLAAFVWKLPVLYVYLLLRCDTLMKTPMCAIRILRGKYIKDVTVMSREDN